MCYALPGPRCSRHAIERLATAEKKMKDATAARDKATQALKVAESDLDKAQLSKEMATAERDIKQAEKMLEGATINHRRSVIARDESLAAYRKRREELAEAKAEYDITPAGIEELRTGVVLRPDTNGDLVDTGVRNEPDFEAATEAALQRQERIAQMPQDPLKDLSEKEIYALAWSTSDPVIQLAIIKRIKAIMDANPPLSRKPDEDGPEGQSRWYEREDKYNAAYEPADHMTRMLFDNKTIAPELLPHMVDIATRRWHERPEPYSPYSQSPRSHLQKVLIQPHVTAATLEVIAEKASAEELNEPYSLVATCIAADNRSTPRTLELLGKKLAERNWDSTAADLVNLRLGRSTWGVLNKQDWVAMTAAGGRTVPDENSGYRTISFGPNISFDVNEGKWNLRGDTDEHLRPILEKIRSLSTTSNHPALGDD